MSFRLFLRATHPGRGLHLAALVTAALGSAVIALLARAEATIRSHGDGDAGSVFVIGTIAALCTVVVLHAISHHSVLERWSGLRQLRIIGLGVLALRRFLLVESMLIALVAGLLGYGASVVLTAPVSDYLASMEITPAGATLHLDASSFLVTLTVAQVTVFAGSQRAARLVTKNEPLHELVRSTPQLTRPSIALVVPAVLAVALLLTWQRAANATSSQQGYFLGLLGTFLAIVLLATIWRPLAGLVVVSIIRHRPGLDAARTVSHRWTATARSSTATTAVVIALCMAVFFVGYPTATDAAARDRLHHLLGDMSVVEIAPSAEIPPAEDALVLTPVDIDIDLSPPDPDREHPYRTAEVAMTESTPAARYLAPALTTGSFPPAGQTGLLLTQTLANDHGLEAGDLAYVRTGAQAPWTPVEITGLLAMPATFGDYLLIDEHGGLDTSTVTDRATTIIGPSAGFTTSGVEAVPADTWIAGLAAGRAFSSSGQGGVGETPLLVGAPLALALTLAGSSMVITTLARRHQLRQLGQLGMSRRAVIGAVAHQALVVTLPPAALAIGTTGALVAAASRAYTDAVAADTTPTAPWPITLALVAALTFVTMTVSIATTRPALFTAD
jgi:hypothetical protein